MKTPGKEAYQRKSVKTASKPTYNRKKVAVSGSDAKGAYKRKEQAVSATAKRLRKRLAGGAD